jgi:transcriptional regulator with XRE-family HTH domain
MNLSIGQKIKALRLTHSASQKVVADHLNLSVPAYSKIETGLSDIAFSRVKLIADFFQISMVDLLKIGESSVGDEQYPDLKNKLVELTTIYNDQQKKMIELYETIRNQKAQFSKT